jgi:hypothetical protein
MMGTRVTVANRQRWFGVGLILATGLLHLVEAPEYYGEVMYIGVLFVASMIGAAVAAYGIWRDERWGWLLGFAVAGAATFALLRESLNREADHALVERAGAAKTTWAPLFAGSQAGQAQPTVTTQADAGKNEDGDHDDGLVRSPLHELLNERHAAVVLPPGFQEPIRDARVVA